MSSLNIRELPADLQNITKSELNENPQTISDELESIKSWLLKQTHLTSRTDNQFLLAFLRSSKHSIERTKEKLDAYYTIRTQIPEIFLNRDPSNERIKQIINLGISIYLPEPHPNGARVILNRPGIYNPTIISLNDVLKVAFMFSDLSMITDDNLIVAGQLVIIDLQGLSTGHAKEITPTFLKKFSKAIQEAYPYRQKGIHFLNPPKIVDILFKIFYNFMNEKFRKRIFVHENLESLHKHIPKNLLPSEYGGESKSINSFTEGLYERFQEHRKWFLEDDQYKSNESERINASKYSNLYVGVEGSFKRLEFD